MKILKKILKSVLIYSSRVGLGFIGLIVYAVISDYKPKKRDDFAVRQPFIAEKFTYISLLTWNIGYAGLDKDMDFSWMRNKSNNT